MMINKCNSGYDNSIEQYQTIKTLWFDIIKNSTTNKVVDLN